MADLGVHTGRNDEGTSRTASDAGAEEHHVLALRQRCLRRTHPGLFLHRLRLSCQGRLIRPHADASTRRASAATRSPASSSTISPRTMSAAAMISA